MIRINLISFLRVRKKGNSRQQVFIYLLSFIVLFLIVAVCNFLLANKVKGLKTKVDTTRLELAKYQKINKEIAAIKKKLSVLEKKVDVIMSLETRRRWPVNLMDSLTGLVVEKRMWLTSFKTKGDTINLEGVALDNQAVADFMFRLQASTLFSSVNLNTLKQEKAGTSGLKLMGFVISCDKASVPAKQKKRVKKG
ncbi:MAG TPA: hypothetical protein DD405_04565 [Desulfobacteraceae bacterium]|nr:hypothetical protein [Desulfobacteraceae bacterium]